jgi:hypothetical protein
MTTLIVNSGACGFTVTVTADKTAGGKIAISLDTACEMVQKMLGDLATLDQRTVFTGFPDNPVYRSAAKHLKHPACLVPAAILKALEVEAGLNVPKDATIIFKKTT